MLNATPDVLPLNRSSALATLKETALLALLMPVTVR